MNKDNIKLCLVPSIGYIHKDLWLLDEKHIELFTLINSKFVIFNEKGYYKEILWIKS